METLTGLMGQRQFPVRLSPQARAVFEDATAEVREFLELHGFERHPSRGVIIEFLVWWWRKTAGTEGAAELTANLLAWFKPETPPMGRRKGTTFGGYQRNPRFEDRSVAMCESTAIFERMLRERKPERWAAWMVEVTIGKGTRIEQFCPWAKGRERGRDWDYLMRWEKLQHVPADELAQMRFDWIEETLKNMHDVHQSVRSRHPSTFNILYEKFLAQVSDGTDVLFIDPQPEPVRAPQHERLGEESDNKRTATADDGGFTGERIFDEAAYNPEDYDPIKFLQRQREKLAARQHATVPDDGGRQPDSSESQAQGAPGLP